MGVQVSALHYSSTPCCLLVPFPVHRSLLNSQTRGCGNKPLIYGSSHPTQEEDVPLKTFVRFPASGGGGQGRPLVFNKRMQEHHVQDEFVCKRLSDKT